MTIPASPQDRQTRRRLVAALCLVGAGAVAGCERNTETESALAEAGAQLTALNSQGLAAVDSEQRASTYSAVISRVSGVAGSADGASSALAKTLLAQAYLGQAEIASEGFGDRVIDVTREAARAGALMSSYAGNQSLVSSLTGYDPSEDLAALDDQASTLSADLSRLQDDARTQQQAINQLEEQSAEQERLAEEKRQESGELSERALSAPPRERANLLALAQGVKRERELIYKRAEELNAEADALRPSLLETQQRLASIRAQIDATARARAQVIEEADALRADADGARANADRVSSELGSLLDGIRANVDGDLGASFSEVESLVERALGELNQARRSGSEVAVQNLEASAKALQATHARTMADVMAILAGAFDRASALEPPIARSAELAQHAEAFRVRAEELRLTAADSFSEVGDLVSRQQADASQQAAEELAALSATLRGEEPEAEELDLEGDPGTESEDGSGADDPTAPDAG